MAVARSKELTQDGSRNGDTARSEHPEGAFGALIAAYAGATGAFVAWRQLSGRGLPDRYEAGDLALLGIATHKASRLLSRDKVTAPLRRPFARYEDESDLPSELSERPRGRGLRKAVGELVVCPYCVSQWVGTGFATGLVTSPRVTRFVASTLAVISIADFLHTAYRAAEEAS
jgi:Protein of unknown function (DUF1360)